MRYFRFFYFGDVLFVAAGAGFAAPGVPFPVNFDSRSTSCLASIATGEFAGELLTALFAETNASGYCFR